MLYRYSYPRRMALVLINSNDILFLFSIILAFIITKISFDYFPLGIALSGIFLCFFLLFFILPRCVYFFTRKYLLSAKSNSEILCIIKKFPEKERIMSFGRHLSIKESFDQQEVVTIKLPQANSGMYTISSMFQILASPCFLINIPVKIMLKNISLDTLLERIKTSSLCFLKENDWDINKCFTSLLQTFVKREDIRERIEKVNLERECSALLFSYIEKEFRTFLNSSFPINLHEIDVLIEINSNEKYYTINVLA